MRITLHLGELLVKLRILYVIRFYLYSNSHTQASFCGSYITSIRETARSEIARMACATSESSIIFTGSGTTAGINKLVGLLNIGKMISKKKLLYLLDLMNTIQIYYLGVTVVQKLLK